MAWRGSHSHPPLASFITPYYYCYCLHIEQLQLPPALPGHSLGCLDTAGYICSFTQLRTWGQQQSCKGAVSLYEEITKQIYFQILSPTSRFHCIVIVIYYVQLHLKHKMDNYLDNYKLTKQNVTLSNTLNPTNANVLF